MIIYTDVGLKKETLDLYVCSICRVIIRIRILSLLRKLATVEASDQLIAMIYPSVDVIKKKIWPIGVILWVLLCT
jgi:hypothetical protein